MFFIDADVLLTKKAIEKNVTRLIHYQLSFLSIFPRQITKSFWEKLIVPIIDISLYSGLNLMLANYIHSPWLSAANGQCMIWRRNIYEQIGGHCCVKNEILEDMALIRRLKKAKIKAWTIASNGDIFCRMYHNLSDIWYGFTKNAFGLKNFGSFIYLFIGLFILSTHFLPLYYLIFFKYIELPALLLLTLFIWKILNSLFWKHSFIISVLSFPINGLIFFIFLLATTYYQIFKNLQWKGRFIYQKN